MKKLEANKMVNIEIIRSCIRRRIRFMQADLRRMGNLWKNVGISVGETGTLFRNL